MSSPIDLSYLITSSGQKAIGSQMGYSTWYLTQNPTENRGVQVHPSAPIAHFRVSEMLLFCYQKLVLNSKWRQTIVFILVSFVV